MKLRVMHKDGRTEVLSLKGPFSIVCGEFLNRLIGGEGIEHFFTHDGYYDGWGAGTDATQREDAGEIARALEEKRVFTE